MIFLSSLRRTDSDKHGVHKHTCACVPSIAHNFDLFSCFSAYRYHLLFLVILKMSKIEFHFYFRQIETAIQN